MTYEYRESGVASSPQRAKTRYFIAPEVPLTAADIGTQMVDEAIIYETDYTTAVELLHGGTVQGRFEFMAGDSIAAAPQAVVDVLLHHNSKPFKLQAPAVTNTKLNTCDAAPNFTALQTSSSTTYQVGPPAMFTSPAGWALAADRAIVHEDGAATVVEFKKDGYVQARYAFKTGQDIPAEPAVVAALLNHHRSTETIAVK